MELKEKENRFQTLAAALPGVLYTVVEELNGPTHFEYLSPVFEEIHEIPAREVINDATSLFEQIHPDDREDYQRAVIESLETLQPFIHQWRVIVPSGKVKWLQANSQPEYRRNGEVVWHGFVQDITERKNLELALQASEARLKDILDNANVILSSLRVFGDGRWIIDHVSAASEQIAGFTAQELTVDNSLWVSRIEPEDWQRIFPELMDSIWAGRPITNEYRLNHKDGSQRWISQATTSRYDSERDCWSVTNVAADISERHAIERVKDEFISVVSHELRTPLTSLKGALGLLSAGVLEKQPETARGMLAIATRNCDRLIHLVNDILDLERLQSGRVELKLELCNVADLMTQAVDCVAILALNAGITLDCYPLKLTTTIDPEAIGKILTNLLGNAIKFSPASSTIRLQAQVIHTNGSFSTPSLLFSVEDRGRGIPQDKLQSIFGRFQQVDISDARQKGGTGLGLAICKTIVSQHGGKIWAESVLGEGSTFYFTIPIGQKLTIDQD
jgi:PAS domain S-box-containing protein